LRIGAKVRSTATLRHRLVASATNRQPRVWRTCSAREAEKNALLNRKPPLARITGSPDHVDGANRWLLGYLSSQLISADSEALDSMSRQADEAGDAERVDDLKRLNQELETPNQHSWRHVLTPHGKSTN
jgi:hypothetical protein